MAARIDRKALLALIFGASLLGAGTALVRLSGTGAAAAGFWRLVFALPGLVLLVAHERRGGGLLARGAGAPLGVLALCGFSFAMDLVCWHYSLRLTSIAISTVLANLTPIIVTVIAWLLFRERPQGRFIAGLALALAGAWAMAATAHGGPAGSRPALGDLFGVGASFCYAIYFIAVRRARETASALQVMLGSSLAAAPIVLIAALLSRETIIPASAYGWAACVALGVMHIGGQGTIAYGLGKVPTSLAAVVVLVQPIVAACVGWIVFGEAVGPLQALGGATALVGIAVAQAAARKAPPVEGEAEPLGA